YLPIAGAKTSDLGNSALNARCPRHAGNHFVRSLPDRSAIPSVVTAPAASTVAIATAPIPPSPAIAVAVLLIAPRLLLRLRLFGAAADPGIAHRLVEGLLQ